MADDVGGAGRQLVSSSSMLNGSNWLRYQQIKLRLFWGTVDFMILFSIHSVETKSSIFTHEPHSGGKWLIGDRGEWAN